MISWKDANPFTKVNACQSATDQRSRDYSALEPIGSCMSLCLQNDTGLQYCETHIVDKNDYVEVKYLTCWDYSDSPHVFNGY